MLINPNLDEEYIEFEFAKYNRGMLKLHDNTLAIRPTGTSTLNIPVDQLSEFISALALLMTKRPEVDWRPK